MRKITKSRSGEDAKIRFLIVTTILVFVGILFFQIAVHSNREVVAGALVKNKEYVNETYLIFTDKGVYECSDSWAEGKVNSSDFYNSIETGKRYDFSVYGYRIPLFGHYKNIVSFKPSTDKESTTNVEQERKEDNQAEAGGS